jgi:hypothetical protein
VQRARRHPRLLSWLAFGLAALVAELVGRALTTRIDVGRHVASPSYASADYYPILLAFVKIAIALVLARVAWRVTRARALARAGRSLLDRTGRTPVRAAPRMRVELSPRLWLGAFASTSLIYLVQADAERAFAGRWPLLAPWLHSSALPVFAVLAVVVALAWSAVVRWLADYEDYAAATFAQARRFAAAAPPADRLPTFSSLPPRLLFGLAFESRPPPAAA